MKDRKYDEISAFREKFKETFMSYSLSEISFYIPDLEFFRQKEFLNAMYENFFDGNFEINELDYTIQKSIILSGNLFGIFLNKIFIFLVKEFLYEHGESLLPVILDNSEFLLKKFENFLKTECIELGISKNEHKFSNSILGIFNKLKEDNESVNFMNLYKGVPIVDKGRVISVKRDSVVFELENRLQAIAIKLDGKTILFEDKYFDKYIKAEVVSTNFLDNEITMNNFVSVLNLPIAQREFIRVYPDISIKVTLENSCGEKITGQLFDLSQNGLGVVSENELNICSNQVIRVYFYLSYEKNEENFIDTKGEIVDSIEYESAYRFCIKIEPNKKIIEKIKKYVLKREKDTIEDLKNEFNNYIL